jgi:nucleotide-binding universal stress UspA family protein
MSIREVLVATDFSEIADEAVSAARHHAERFGARLHLLHVLEAAEGDAPQRLARLSEGLPVTIPVLVRAPAGDPAHEIARYAREHVHRGGPTTGMQPGRHTPAPPSEIPGVQGWHARCTACDIWSRPFAISG